jgi:2'-5' RNA ligase
VPGPIRTLLPQPSRIRRVRLGKPATWWPPIAVRQDDAYRNIWQALRQHGEVEPPPSTRLAWAERADSYAVCAIRVPPTAEVREALAPIRDALRRFPFVALFPPGSLYITIQELGLLVDEPEASVESSSARIEEFCRQAALPISDFPAFEIELGGFNSFLDMPFLDVHDDGWCFRIHHRLRDFVAGTLDDTYAYLPYVPLGYYTQATEMGPFPARMAPWRDARVGRFTAESVDVLRVSTRDPLAMPEVMHRFELGHHIRPTDAIREGNAPREIL